MTVSSETGRAGQNILLVVTGLTPQVVTETVYALMRDSPSSLPDEVHIISTAEGARRARLMLLTDEPRWLRPLVS